MFGYIKVNQEELKIREYNTYKAYYCGLCHSLNEKYGKLGQITLTYDMTFFVIFMSSLYEPRIREIDKICIVHPGKKQHKIINEITEYAADMNILLAYKNFQDDWLDEKSLRGLMSWKLLKRKALAVESKYQRQGRVIEENLRRLSELEKEKCDNIDQIAKPFANIISEIAIWREDPFQKILRKFGFYLGKYVYILDAILDYEKDKKKGTYNPFLYEKNYLKNPDEKNPDKQEPDKEKIKKLLDNTIKLAIVEFEKLPMDQDLSLLRNILYEGIWTDFNKFEKEGSL